MASKSEASDIESLIETIPLHRIRNFAIVAHVDHGKVKECFSLGKNVLHRALYCAITLSDSPNGQSTLADRLLQMTGLIESGANAQVCR